MKDNNLVEGIVYIYSSVQSHFSRRLEKNLCIARQRTEKRKLSDRAGNNEISHVL
jgi:hypothetical protein